jgi:hypothetical protein
MTSCAPLTDAMLAQDGGFEKKGEDQIKQLATLTKQQPRVANPLLFCAKFGVN